MAYVLAVDASLERGSPGEVTDAHADHDLHAPPKSIGITHLTQTATFAPNIEPCSEFEGVRVRCRRKRGKRGTARVKRPKTAPLAPRPNVLLGRSSTLSVPPCAASVPRTA
eukprot:3456623-Rhodomonas_salina.1